MNIPFIQAKNFTKCTMRRIDLVVIHSMENPEKPGTAMAVAKWFASAKSPKASCHFCIDNASIVQCVGEMDVAWCAPGANARGVHLEHCGYARQTEAQWLDAFSESMLGISAKLTAQLCAQYGLPIAFVDAEGLLEGDRGVTTHAEVTEACKLAKYRGLTKSPFFKAKTDHTDPGKGFPMDAYLAMVREEAGR